MTLFLEAVSRAFKSKHDIKITLIYESNHVHAVVVLDCAITIVSLYMNVASSQGPEGLSADSSLWSFEVEHARYHRTMRNLHWLVEAAR